MCVTMMLLLFTMMLLFTMDVRSCDCTNADSFERRHGCDCLRSTVIGSPMKNRNVNDRGFVTMRCDYTTASMSITSGNARLYRFPCSLVTLCFCYELSITKDLRLLHHDVCTHSSKHAVTIVYRVCSLVC